jgi:hypothetical protein
MLIEATRLCTLARRENGITSFVSRRINNGTYEICEGIQESKN